MKYPKRGSADEARAISRKEIAKQAREEMAEELKEWLENDNSYDYMVGGDVAYVSTVDLLGKLEELK